MTNHRRPLIGIDRVQCLEAVELRHLHVEERLRGLSRGFSNTQKYEGITLLVPVDALIFKRP